MRLDKKRYEPALLKENLLIFYEELIRAIKPNSQLIEKSLYIAFQETKAYIMALNPKIIYWKYHLQRKPFGLSGSDHNQVLLTNPVLLTHGLTHGFMMVI